MLVLVLPGILLTIIGGIIWSAYMIFRPDPLATVEDKMRAQQRPRATRRGAPRR